MSMPAVEVKITYRFARSRDKLEVGTSFLESEVAGYMQEFDLHKFDDKRELAINGLADMYLFNNFGPAAILVDAKEVR